MLALRWAGRRRRLRPAPGRLGPRRRLAASLGVGAVVIAGALIVPSPSAPGRGGDGRGLLVSVLDVGQGDAILLEPADGRPVLVDAGPPGAEVAGELDRRGIEELAALVLTHPDSDHAGGAPDVLGAIGVDHLLFARADRATLGAARVAAVDAERVAGGSALRSGSLRLQVLWPSRPALRARDELSEPNALSLVLLARWHGFRALLAGDAEAELAPVHPGDLDVLKLAHHGSEDAGLEALLAEAAPELAVISVGAGNPYGHPAPATLAALGRAEVEVLRTDTDGEVSIAVGPDGWSVDAG